LRDERGESALECGPWGGDGVGGGGVEIGDKAAEVGRGGEPGDFAGGEGALERGGGAEGGEEGGTEEREG
jgi:hypothetical protein